MPFTVKLSPRARDNLKALRTRDQQLLIDSIEAKLIEQPDLPARNRKRMAENPLAPWELRVGAFRVFYDVILDDRVVVVVAIGEKTHNVLRIAGEEMQL